MKLFFDRNFPECDVFLAKDGLEALSMCKTQKFDLALIDIEMPGLTGLELMSSLKQNGFDGQLLVITAYSRFSYAQKVVELGASAYILKPIETEELRSQVSLCLEKQRRMGEISSRQQIMRKRLVEAYRPIEKDFWEAVDNQKYIALEKMLASGVLGFSQIMGRLIRIKTGTASCTALPFPMLEDILHLAFANHFTAYLNVLYEDELYIYLNSGTLDRKYLELAPYLLAAIFIKNGYPQVRIGVSKQLVSIEDLLYTRSNNIRLSQDGTIILRQQNYHMSMKENTSLQNRLTRAVSAGPKLRDAGIRFLRENYFSNDSDCQSEIYDIITTIVLEIALKLVDMDKIDSAIERLIDIAISAKEPLSAVDNMLQVISWYLEEDMEYAKIAVDRAVTFMKENLSNPITLSDTAKYAGLSESHFSRVFSHITGHKYIAYLTGLRMEWAKSLLKTENMMLNELAQCCGYQSSSHFCTVFKRYTGETITQYKAHLKKQ